MRRFFSTVDAGDVGGCKPRPLRGPAQAWVRVFDTDDAERLWCAVVAALRALGFRVERVESGDSIAVTRASAKGCFDSLKVQVIPRGDAQLVVRVELAAGIGDAEEPVPSESIFELISQELYLTAHRV